jgi:hypothetical protein
MRSTVLVGVNIYYWGETEQNRLLCEALPGWSRLARHLDAGSRMWYCRFDARSPHIFALFSTSEAQEPALRTLLDDRVRTFLAEFPSACNLSASALEERHRACRGKALSPIDRLDGLADNNSFVLFRHDSCGYPFHRMAGTVERHQLSRWLSRLSCWSIGALKESSTLAAARWLAAVDHAIANTIAAQPGLAESYWRYHAGTLVVNHEGAADADQLVPLLPKLVSGRNREKLSAIWDDPRVPERAGLDFGGLMRFVFDGRRPVPRSFELLRELNHTVLGQLGVWLTVQLPIILYAWQRNLH